VHRGADIGGVSLAASGSVRGRALSNSGIGCFGAFADLRWAWNRRRGTTPDGSERGQM